MSLPQETQQAVDQQVVDQQSNPPYRHQLQEHHQHPQLQQSQHPSRQPQQPHQYHHQPVQQHPHPQLPPHHHPHPHPHPHQQQQQHQDQQQHQQSNDHHPQLHLQQQAAPLPNAHQPQDLSQVVAAASAAVADDIGENLQCQWQDCGERCTSAQALYDHVCERHVGRQSTNNRNLTCRWGSCRTTVVKRDHITSHIRVHVPLKPHKCEFCNKAFKRPQDLKKHVKTHADDSVILRSPESTQPRSSGNMYVPNEKGPSTYYSAINPNGGYDAHHPGTNQFYHPQHTHQGSHQPYGNVYYTPAPTQQAALSDVETRKRGLNALDQFFGEVKARRFDPSSYQNISQRLFELQSLQLPLITQQPPMSAVPAYQPVAAVAAAAAAAAAAGGHGNSGGGRVGGMYDSNDGTQASSLPPMINAKSRSDLTSIDHMLEQMQTAIYENDSQLAQAGVAQPGAHYMSYRTDDSPSSVTRTSAQMQPTLGAQQRPPQQLQPPQNQHAPMTSTSESIHSSTPALTPTSSQSYASGRSPIPSHIAPLHGPIGNGAGLSSAHAIYPSLPSVSMETNYHGGAPNENTATLSGLYDSEEQRNGRRWNAGTLQRAPAGLESEPADGGAGDGVGQADPASDDTATPPAAAHKAKASKRGRKRGRVQDSRAVAETNNPLIDPALAGVGAAGPTDAATAAAAAAATAALKSPASTAGGGSGSGEITERDLEKEYTWMANMRLIEWMRGFVKKRLQEGEFEDNDHGDGDGRGGIKQEEGGGGGGGGEGNTGAATRDVIMGEGEGGERAGGEGEGGVGHDQGRARSDGHGDGVETNADARAEAAAVEDEKTKEALYPILKETAA